MTAQPITAPVAAPAAARRGRREWGIAGAITVTALLASVLTLGAGARGVGWLDGVAAIAGRLDPDTATLVERFLVPRVLLCWLVGIALAVSGGVLQGVIRNPLAAPDIIGITKGAGVAAMAALLLWPSAPVAALPVAAFAGGVAAALLVYLFAYRRGTSPARLALVGIAVSALCEGGVRFLLVRNPLDVNAALSWLTGSMFGRTMTHVVQFAPWVVVLVPLLLYYARRLDTLGLGDDLATGLGEPVERTRRITLLLAVALAAAAVSVAGTVGFVGLIAPHMARRLVGGRHLALLPTAAALGALLLLLADAVGRGVAPPLEIPVGLITALVGGPYFLYLLTKTGK
ncbi:iron ABC transporter permease [Micromonospora sp. NPDC050200]|uniref:FecCD family ABC transporter permease n=1 Tax=Micromonospora sp. NPDC050200 TaxID=3155664 RepID=UPI003404D971